MIQISDTTLTQLKPNLLEKWILKVFSHGDSCAGVVMGRRNTGKTDHALLIAEVLFKFHKISRFAANIKIYETPPNMEIIHICDLETLTSWAAVEPGRKLYILDEAGKAFRRRTPMSKLNIELLDKLQILRKYKLNLIMITPAEKYIDGASIGSDVIDFVVVKPEFNNQKIGDYFDAMRRENISFANLPGTRIKFDTWDIAPFTLKPVNSKINFPSKAVEYCYKNAKEGLTADKLGIDHKQLNRFYKQSILYFVENQVSRDVT